MASLPHGISDSYTLCRNREISFVGITIPPFSHLGYVSTGALIKGSGVARRLYKCQSPSFPRIGFNSGRPKKVMLKVPSSSTSSNSSGNEDESSDKTKTPFGYTRKDVLLIGLGVTAIGFGLKSGLEYVGVDPLLAGNAVQLIVVLGLTVGWISTYIFRVSNKEMTYAQQLRDYENKVMQKRLESLSEAELEALLEQVEEDKTRLSRGEQLD